MKFSLATLALSLASATQHNAEGFFRHHGQQQQHIFWRYVINLAAGTYGYDHVGTTNKTTNCFETGQGIDYAGAGVMNFVYEWVGQLLGSEEGLTIFYLTPLRSAPISSLRGT